jgi:FAD/FMN-containing dehydrogenase
MATPNPSCSELNPPAYALILADELAEIVGTSNVLTDPDLLVSYGTDWTRRWSALPLLVVRPADVEQVSAVVLACGAAGVGIVPQGGNTGLVGGGVPRVGAEPVVVLSLRRLNEIESVTPDSDTVVVGAGVVLADLQRAAAAAGRRYAVDEAARESATIGGNVSTNAAGLRAVGLGDTRAQVAGLEYVRADGKIVRTSGFTGEQGPDKRSKPAIGADLEAAELIGTEGTLVIVTAARVRLIDPPASAPRVTLVGVADIEEALVIVDAAASAGVIAAEYFTGGCLRHVLEVTGLPRPLDEEHEGYLLLETRDEPVLETLPHSSDLDAAIDERLWAYRDRVPESIAADGVPHKLDVRLARDQLGAFVRALPAVITPYEPLVYGHIGVGNLHVNVLGPEPDDTAMDDAVLGLVVELGGDVAAEHGVGVAKVDWWQRSLRSRQLDVLMRQKADFDPSGLLNPGVRFG